MNSLTKFAVAAAAVAVIVFVGLRLLPGQGSVGGPPPSESASPSLSPIASPSASNVPAEFPNGPLEAGTYRAAPFAAGMEGMCHLPPQSGCTETAADDTIRFTITIPDGWSGIGTGVFTETTPTDTASLLFARGGWLLSDPCKYIATDVPVGPTVADFVDAVAEHPLLDTTPPVDVTLAGYSGKSFELQVPADISNCETEPGNPSSGPIYRPWEPGIYAQGPSHRWHLWVIDVDGVRVLVQSMDYPGTPEQRRTELQAIVDSIKIEP